MCWGARLSSALKPTFVKNTRELSYMVFNSNFCCLIGKCELFVSCLHVHNQKTRKWVWWRSRRFSVLHRRLLRLMMSRSIMTKRLLVEFAEKSPSLEQTVTEFKGIVWICLYCCVTVIPSCLFLISTVKQVSETYPNFHSYHVFCCTSHKHIHIWNCSRSVLQVLY